MNVFTTVFVTLSASLLAAGSAHADSDCHDGTWSRTELRESMQRAGAVIADRLTEALQAEHANARYEVAAYSVNAPHKPPTGAIPSSAVPGAADPSSTNAGRAPLTTPLCRRVGSLPAERLTEAIARAYDLDLRFMDWSAVPELRGINCLLMAEQAELCETAWIEEAGDAVRYLHSFYLRGLNYARRLPLLVVFDWLV